jgi:DNA replication protein DnaC
MKVSGVYKGIAVEADFKDHINILFGHSGTGKSFLFSVLSNFFRRQGLACTYVNYGQVKSIEGILKGIDNLDVLMLDNADLYMSREIFSILVNCRATVIMSIKSMKDVRRDKVGIYRVTYLDNTLSTERWGD